MPNLLNYAKVFFIRIISKKKAVINSLSKKYNKINFNDWFYISSVSTTLAKISP